MPMFNIQVSDRRNKYPTKVYPVEAESELFAYGKATEQFIVDNKHRPINASERRSSYYARFWNQVV